MKRIKDKILILNDEIINNPEKCFEILVHLKNGETKTCCEYSFVPMLENNEIYCSKQIIKLNEIREIYFEIIE